MYVPSNLTPPKPRKLLWPAVFLLADGILLGATDAKKVPAWLLMVGFALVIATAYWLIYAVLAFLRLYGLHIRQKRRLAASLAGLLACVLALESVGELNIKDVLILLPLVIIGYVYASYSLKRQSD